MSEDCRLSVNLNTGDTGPKKGRLLYGVTHWLVKKCKHRILDSYRDQIGTYCYLMVQPGGIKYFLVAKGSEVWQNIVSCQSSILKRALNNAIHHIIMAWMVAEKDDVQIIQFYRFDAAKIQAGNIGPNPRWGSEMTNFPIELGKRWNPKQTTLG